MYLLLKTRHFLLEQPDEDLDCWFLGGDCIAWFYMRLLPVPGIEPGYNPTMCDWNGWSCSVNVDGIEVELLCWCFFPVDAHWILGLKPRNRLFKRHPADALDRAREKVAQAMRKVVKSIPGETKSQWFEQNPWEMKPEDVEL